MKRILFTACLCVVLCASMVAQQSTQQNDMDSPASKADIEKYLEVTHYHEMLNKMLNAMSTPMHKMMHEQYLKHKDVLPPDFEARENKEMDDMLRGMPWDEIEQAMIPSYQKHFTKGEMAALTDFYGSPTGQKILEEMPAVMADAMDSMMPLMQKRIEGMQHKVEEQMAEILKDAEKSHDQKNSETKQN